MFDLGIVAVDDLGDLWFGCGCAAHSWDWRRPTWRLLLCHQHTMLIQGLLRDYARMYFMGLTLLATDVVLDV